MRPGWLKLLFAMAAMAVWSGCASGGPPQPPSLELPVPVNDLHAVRKGDRVYLSWTVPTQTTDQEGIRHAGPTLVCRGREQELLACGTAVATMPTPLPEPGAKAPRGPTKAAVAPKRTATYTDTLPAPANVQPTDKITYAVEAENEHDRSAGLSNQVRVPLFPAMPPPANFAATVTAEGVRFSWACPAAGPPSSDIQYRLRVYRRAEGVEADTIAAETNLMDCQGPPVLDETFEWEKTYEYRATVVTVVSPPGQTELKIEGDDTPRAQVFAHDIFPPAIPDGLQAVFSGVGQKPFVDLIWSPDNDADLAGYNVYRHEEGGTAVKLNSELVKTPAYRDAAVERGKRYYYAVSAVDLRGNESGRSAEANEMVP